MKILNKQSGSVLFSVLIVMSVIVILAVAVMGATAVTHRTAVTRYEREQARYTAESAVSSLISYIQNATAGDALTAAIISLPDGNSISSSSTTPDFKEGMGEYKTTITHIKRDGKNQAVITVTAAYPRFDGGQVETKSVTLKIPENSVWDGTFTATGKNGDTNQLTRNGDLSFTGICHFNNTSDSTPMQLNGTNRIDGSIFDKGSIDLTGRVELSSKGIIGSEQNISIHGLSNDTLNGTLYAQGNISIAGSNCISTQAIYCGGDMTISGVSKMSGDIYVAKDLKVYGDKNCMNGSRVHVGGKYTLVDSEVETPDSKESVESAINTFKSAIPSSPVYNEWDVISEKEKIGEFKNTYNLSLGGDKNPLQTTISESGTLESYSYTNWAGQDCELTIDASLKDIYLKIPSGCVGGSNNFDLGQGVSLRILGTHNVYLCLDEGENWVSSSKKDIGIVDKVDYTAAELPPPQLYLISNTENSIIDLGSELGTFYGYV